jgi:hypothetical protein
MAARAAGWRRRTMRLLDIEDPIFATRKKWDGRWILAKPIGYPGLLTRIVWAWAVLRGRACAVRWL